MLVAENGCETDTSIQTIQFIYDGIPPAGAAAAIFPNPADEVVHVHFAQPNISEVELLDLSGRTVVNYKLVNQLRLEIPLTDLPGGIYFVRCEDQEGNGSVFKLIVK